MRRNMANGLIQLQLIINNDWTWMTHGNLPRCETPAPPLV
jgi:hypothetical protein